jgi:predicted MPP superfamily phosphohydrolase
MKIANIILLISLFVGIYGGFHVYIYDKLKPFFLPHLWLLITILALLGCSIFLVAALTRGSVETPIATPLAYITFIWMGIVFLFFAISVPVDLAAWIIGKTGAQRLHVYLISPGRTTVIGIAVLLITVYGYVASLQINIERLVFESKKITMPIQVVQISDLHLGLISNARYCQKVVDEINALDADIVVSTGDLVDMQMDHLDGLGKLMSSIRARHGKYAVLGNHEALAGVSESREFTERVGFKLLSNRGVTIDNAVNLIGVDDPAVEGRVQQSSVNEPALLKQFDNGLYTILLKHQPVVQQKSRGLFDLQLSGHTHGGQIFPFSLLIHLFYKAPFGLSKQGDNGWLYVSRGTGTWGPPMRVLAKPEITLIRIQSERPLQ